MTAGAYVAALGGPAGLLAFTGRDPVPPPLRDAGVHTVAVPGVAARLVAAEGASLAGHPAVAVLGAEEIPAPVRPAVPVVVDAAGAAAALAAGWAVVCPALPADLQPLLRAAGHPSTVLLAPEAALPQPVPPPAPVRAWSTDGAVTLVASGPGVAAMLGVAERLRPRDLPATALEVAVLSLAQHRALLGGGVLVGPASAAADVARGGWPVRPLRPLATTTGTPRQVWEAVLAALPAGAVRRRGSPAGGAPTGGSSAGR